MKNLFKRIVFVVLFVLVALVFVGCDLIGGGEQNLSDEEIVINVLNDIKIGYAEGETNLTISKNITLPTASIDGCSISWKSNNESIISNTGVVTQADTKKEVKLTVVVTLNETVLEKSFNVTVLEKSSTPVIEDPEEGVTSLASILALNVEEKSETEETYKVQGKITEVQDTTYGNVVITDGTTRLLVWGIYDSEGNRYDAMTDKPAVGDTIVVEGKVKKYNGVNEIVNTTLIKLTKGTTPVTPPVDTLSTIASILALTIEDNNQTTEQYKIKGKITEVQNETFGNVLIKDDTGEILLYGLYDSTGATRYDALDYKPTVGDTITVIGPVKNYKSTYELVNAKILNVEKASTPILPIGDDEVESTIANVLVLEVADGSTTELKYIVTGTIKEVKNTSFGNVVITDGTNDLLVYRMYDANGNRYDTFDYKPVVGDSITVSGVVMNVGGVKEIYESTLRSYTKGSTPVTPPVVTEAIDATIPEILALTVEENATTNEVYRVSGKVTLVSDTTYGNLYITDGTNSLLIYGIVDANGAKYSELTTKPTAGDTITVSGVVKKYNGTLEIVSGLLESLVEGEPEEIKTSTIAEVKKMNSGSVAKVEATVIGVDKKEFLVKDATGALLVYMNYTAFNYVVGDKLTIVGAITEYNGNKQFDNKAEITKVGTETYTDPEPLLLDRDKFEDQFIEKTVGNFVDLNGKLVIEGSYFNIQVEGSDKIAAILYPTSDLNLGLYDGKKIRVAAYTIGINSDGDRLNLLAKTVECLEELSGDGLPQTFDFMCGSKEDKTLPEGWSWIKSGKGSYATGYQSFRANGEGIQSSLFEASNKIKVTFTYYLNNCGTSGNCASYVKVSAYNAAGTVLQSVKSENLNISGEESQDASNVKNLEFVLEGTDIAYITVEFIKDGGGNIGFSTIKIEEAE